MRTPRQAPPHDLPEQVAWGHRWACRAAPRTMTYVIWRASRSRTNGGTCATARFSTTDTARAWPVQFGWLPAVGRYDLDLRPKPPPLPCTVSAPRNAATTARPHIRCMASGRGVGDVVETAVCILKGIPEGSSLVSALYICVPTGTVGVLGWSRVVDLGRSEACDPGVDQPVSHIGPPVIGHDVLDGAGL